MATNISRAVWLIAVLCPALAAADGKSASTPACKERVDDKGEKSATIAHGVPAVLQVLRIDRTQVSGQRTQSSNFTLYANGAWSFAQKHKKDRTGCLPPASVQKIRTELAAADWITKHADNKCAAISETVTEYRVDGKVVLERRMCDGLILNAKTEKSLNDAVKTMNTLTKQTP